MARYVTFLLLALFTMATTAAFAAEDVRVVEARGQEYQARFVAPDVGQDAPSSATIIFAADLSMALENDAPVLSTRFRYRFGAWRYVLPAIGPGQRQIWSSEDASAFPQEAPRIQPTEIGLMFRFYAPAQNSRVGIAQQIANPGAPGAWTDSSPQRPGWENTFVWLSGINKGEWLSAETARSVWQGELQPEGVTVIEASWSAANLMRFMAEHNMRSRAIAIAEAVNRVLDGAARSFGYQVEDLREDPGLYLEPAFRRGVPIALLRKLERLQNLPVGLKQGDPAAYDQAMSEANKIISLMERDRASYLDAAEKPVERAPEQASKQAPVPAAEEQ